MALRHASWIGWGGAAYSAVFASLLGHGVYYLLVQRHPVAQVTPWLLLALTALVSARASATPAPAADRLPVAGDAHGFDRFLRRYEAANTAFVNGDPSLWLSMRKGSRCTALDPSNGKRKSLKFQSAQSNHSVSLV